MKGWLGASKLQITFSRLGGGMLCVYLKSRLQPNLVSDKFSNSIIHLHISIKWKNVSCKMYWGNGERYIVTVTHLLASLSRSVQKCAGFVLAMMKPCISGRVSP